MTTTKPRVAPGPGQIGEQLDPDVLEQLGNQLTALLGGPVRQPPQPATVALPDPSLAVPEANGADSAYTARIPDPSGSPTQSAVTIPTTSPHPEPPVSQGRSAETPEAGRGKMASEPGVDPARTFQYPDLGALATHQGARTPPLPVDPNPGLASPSGVSSVFPGTGVVSGASERTPSLSELPHGQSLREAVGESQRYMERSLRELGLPTGVLEPRAEELRVGSVPRSSTATAPLQESPLYFLNRDQMAGATPEVQRGFDVESVRRDFPALQQEVHGKPLIWLDSAATSQKPQSVIDQVRRFYENDNSNVHRGAHTLAERATNAYEDARKKVQQFLGAQAAHEIIFVRGTTEAINLVAQAFGRRHVDRGDEILISELEHHSNIVPWQLLARERGAQLRVAPINDRGEVILDEYEKLLGPRTRIVALSHVSNVLGTVLPVREMTEMAHRYGARVLIDGAQSVPHFRANVQEIDADFYVFSGHKLFAPTGIGVLFGKADLLDQMPPWQGGGSMIKTVSFEETIYAPIPYKFEAGTPIIAGATGLGAAIDYLEKIGFEAASRHEHEVLQYALDQLIKIPGLRMIGSSPTRVSVVSFTLAGIPTQELGRFLDRQGIAVRAGHHCAQPVLRHYGLEASVRPSLAFYNTKFEIDALVAALLRAQSELG